MKRKMAFALSFLLLCSAAAAAGTLDRIKQSGRINIGYTTEARPFSYRDESGNPTGYAIEVCKRVADALKADLGLPALALNFISTSHENGVATLEQGKIDLYCAPVPASSVLRKRVAFTAPIFLGGVSAVVRADASPQLKDILYGRAPQLRGNESKDQVLQRATFAVVAGTPAERVLNERLKEMQIKTSVLPVDDFAAGVERVLEYRAEAFFADRAVLLDAVKRSADPGKLQILDRYFTEERGALALAQGDEALRRALDRSLAQLYRSADFNALYAKWFGASGDAAQSLLKLNASAE